MNETDPVKDVFGMDNCTHRRRLGNLADAHAMVGSCLRHHYIRSYTPGQVVYNLGEYPGRFSIAPTAYDEARLSQLAGEGVKVILLHEEWNDSQRRLGADKFSSHDPEGFKRLINLIHGLGLKALPYLSPCYFEKRDPDFNPSWNHPGAELDELFFYYASCCPASPEWRAYLLPRAKRILEEYGVDGFWLDLGYPMWDTPQFMGRPVPCDGAEKKEKQGHLSPAPESPDHDAALEDLLCLIYDLAHGYQGIISMHYGASAKVASRERIYDYVFVGEGQDNLDQVRVKIKHWEPYVLTLTDMSRAKVATEKDLYLHSIPYMQFPFRLDGRPLTGERACISGIVYHNDFWTQHLRWQWEYYQKHPDGPYAYGIWDSCPPNPERHKLWSRYFQFYRPMVQEGTRAWLEIQDGSLFETPLPEDVTGSLFVNDETYLVLANYGSNARTIKTTGEWKDRETDQRGNVWNVPARTLKFFLRARKGINE